MFTYVSGANFFGEIVEWAGFAIACWSLPSLAFFLFTAFNIGPRAVQHHRYHMCIKIVVLHFFPLLVLIIFKKGILTPFFISDVFFIYGFDKQCYKHFVVQTVLLFFFSSFCYLNAQNFMFLGMLKESDGNR